MVSVVTPSSPAAEQKVILHDISWETYERLLAEHDPGPGIRFTYDEGNLQIVVLSTRHEMPNRLLALLVEVIAGEWKLAVLQAGSVTLKRPDLHKGFEPDTCFYFRHIEHVMSKEKLDLTEDPPPDLVIEVDISRPSLNKFPLFAAVGIGEVWRYDTRRVYVHLLEQGRYVESPESKLLAPLTADQISRFVIDGLGEPRRYLWMERVRHWARTNR